MLKKFQQEILPAEIKAVWDQRSSCPQTSVRYQCSVFPRSCEWYHAVTPGLRGKVHPNKPCPNPSRQESPVQDRSWGWTGDNSVTTSHENTETHSWKASCFKLTPRSLNKSRFQMQGANAKPTREGTFLIPKEFIIECKMQGLYHAHVQMEKL